MEDDIEDLLHHWARFEFNLRMGNLGYPDKNIISTMMTGTAAQGVPGSRCLISQYSKAQQVSFWIVSLGQHNYAFREAIELFYLSKSHPADIAKGLGISVRTYRQRVHDAKLWLAGRLSAEKERSSIA